MISPSHITYTNLGATGTADHLTLLRLLFSCVSKSVDTLQLCAKVRGSIHPSVCQSVTFTFLWGFLLFDLPAPAQILWWPKIQPLPTCMQLGSINLGHFCLSKIIFYHYFVPLSFDDGLLVNKKLNKSLWIFLGDIMRLDVDAIVNVENQVVAWRHLSCSQELAAG